MRAEPRAERHGGEQEPELAHDRERIGTPESGDDGEHQRDGSEQGDGRLDIDGRRHDRRGDDGKAEAERAVGEPGEQAGEADEREDADAQLGRHGRASTSAK
jgi:hypothetical protein